MKKELLFAGFGGQGILLIGKTIGQAAMTEGRYVTYLPSYGPEMRSGTSNCSIVISDEPIASPLVAAVDVLVAMNQPSYVKFSPRVRSGGVMVINTTLITPDERPPAGVTIAGGDFTQQAIELGSVQVCSMIALGHVVRESGLVALESVIQEMKLLTAKRPEFIALNEQALLLGYETQ